MLEFFSGAKAVNLCVKAAVITVSWLRAAATDGNNHTQATDNICLTRLSGSRVYDQPAALMQCSVHLWHRVLGTGSKEKLGEKLEDKSTESF